MEQLDRVGNDKGGDIRLQKLKERFPAFDPDTLKYVVESKMVIMSPWLNE